MRSRTIVHGLQACLVFVLGILGNKAAELVRLSPETVIFSAVAVLTASIGMTVRLEGQPFRPSTHQAEGGSSRFVPRSMVSVFPVGTALGLLAAVGLPSLFPERSPIGFGAYQYEIVACVFLAVGVLLVAIFQSAYLAASSGVGFAAGAATTFLVTRPEQNQVAMTYAGQLGFAVVIGAIVILFEDNCGLWGGHSQCHDETGPPNNRLQPTAAGALLSRRG